MKKADFFKQITAIKQAIGLMVLTIGLFLSSITFGYVGPGAGVSAIGSAIAFLAVVFLLIVGFLWYPLKKIFSKNKKKESEMNSNKNNENSDQAKGL